MANITGGGDTRGIAGPAARGKMGGMIKTRLGGGGDGGEWGGAGRTKEAQEVPCDSGRG